MSSWYQEYNNAIENELAHPIPSSSNNTVAKEVIVTPQKTKKSKAIPKAISKATKELIVKKVTKDLISPTKLAAQYKFDVATIRKWVKKSGAVLPLKYSQPESSKSEVHTLDNSGFF